MRPPLLRTNGLQLQQQVLQSEMQAENEKTNYYAFRYNDRISSLAHYANVYAMSIIIASQFIYFNLHYIIGATLTIIAVCSLLFQVVISSVEKRFLLARRLDRLNMALEWQFWMNHVFILGYIPFLLWAVSLMYQRSTV